jgi:hypothetical protein
MDRKIQLYVGAADTKRLELFNDEQINVTSTVQNIQDLSKNFTDFSQSFTIPASDYNNAILEHFYQSDVNSSLDYNIRLDAFIEIDLTFFRRGKLQVEKANIKNNRPDSYTVTFYGDGTSIKGFIAEDLLSDLDYDVYNHIYTWDAIYDRIVNGGTTYDVKYPLISSQRIWQYQNTVIDATTPDWLTLGSGNDIHTGAGAIAYTELCPALRVSKIFDLIESKYGVTFTGTFLNDKRFTDLFLWYKNANGINRTGQSSQIDITSVNYVSGDFNLSSSVNITNNSITTNYISGLSTGVHTIKLDILSVSNGSVYYIDTYQNGNLIGTTQCTGTGVRTIVNSVNTSGLNTTYTFFIRTTATMTLTHELTYEVLGVSGNTQVYAILTTTNAATNVLLYLNLSANAPKMKVIDFFSGILKTFNLVCVGTGLNQYELAPLDTWYGQGRILDISKHVEIDSIDVQRMPLYKKIGFDFQPSESVLNKQFSQTYNREYGNILYQYDYDGGEYVTQLPFENLLQQKFTGTDLQVGYCLNNEFAPYVPKPILLYQYDNQTCDFQFTNGQQPVHITSYTPFGQDLLYNNENHTLNFAAETSSLLLVPIQNTLFSEYNFSYLYNLYNLKQRLVNVKTKLPTSILTSLKLNDRVIIRDKRYIINDMKSNLTNGEVDFSLYLDFRPMINTNIPIVEPNGGTVFLAFNIPNEGESIVLSPSEEVTLSESVLRTSQTITATVGASEPNTFFTIDVTYNFKNGTTTNDTVSILSFAETSLLKADSSRFTADQNITIDQREGFPTR